MRCSLCIITALLLSCAALAAPAPDPFISGWRTPIDPDRDCKIRRSNGTLIIEMPGSDHDYDSSRDRFNAPRIVREMEGDFVMQVRIRIEESDSLNRMLKTIPAKIGSGASATNRTTNDAQNDFRPSAESTAKDRPSFVAGGFLVIPPESFDILFFNMQYGVAGAGTAADGFATVLSRDIKGGGYLYGVYDKHWPKWPFKSKPEHVYLRLERKDELMLYRISLDAKEWTTIGGGGIQNLPTKLKVGLGAYTTSTEPSKVCFDQLKLTRGKKNPLQQEERK